ncbi:hypothetical protein FQN53_004648 [Emmonsiellopsis sp. PD_33]|nr:hypothetical protein FQN53_004648 [Emmonsiellopsis sp. PD_33]
MDGPDKNPKCNYCSHPKAEHSNKISDKPDQSAIIPDAFIEDRSICPRDKTVETLTALLNKENVVLVHGTAKSGKTILARLLRRFLLRNGEMVVYMDRLSNAGNLDSWLVQSCRTSGYTKISTHNVLTSDIVFLIDDAEKTYPCTQLWDKIIIPQFTDKEVGPRNKRARFCLFSSSQNHPAIIPDSTSKIPIFGQTQMVSLAVSTQLGAPAISLCYNETEYADVVRRFHENPEKKPAIDHEVKEYIFSLTNGHPGAVQFMLEYIHHYHRSPFQPGHDITITMKDVRKIMADIERLCGDLERSSMKTSLPITTTYHATLSQVLKFGSVGDSMVTTSDLFEGVTQGWLQSDWVEGGRIAYTLASRLHAMYVEYRIGPSPQPRYVEYRIGPSPQPWFFEKYSNIGTLCLELVKLFSTTSLCQNFEGKTISPGGKRRSRKTAFHDEFYRCLLQRIGGTMRDITEHCGHFQKGGKFFSRKLKQWIILDCRHSHPEKHYPNEKNLWRVIFSEDHSTLYILDGEGKELLPETDLTNKYGPPESRIYEDRVLTRKQSNL